MSNETVQQTVKIHPRWIAYYGALVLLFVLLAQVESLKTLAVALAWLLAVSVLVNLIDPNGKDLFGLLKLEG